MKFGFDRTGPDDFNLKPAIRLSLVCESCFLPVPVSFSSVASVHRHNASPEYAAEFESAGGLNAGADGAGDTSSGGSDGPSSEPWPVEVDQNTTSGQTLLAKLAPLAAGTLAACAQVWGRAGLCRLALGDTTLAPCGQCNCAQCRTYAEETHADQLRNIGSKQRQVGRKATERIVPVKDRMKARSMDDIR
jgi:hypothetical protein